MYSWPIKTYVRPRPVNFYPRTTYNYYQFRCYFLRSKSLLPRGKRNYTGARGLGRTRAAARLSFLPRRELFLEGSRVADGCSNRSPLSMFAPSSSRFPARVLYVIMMRLANLRVGTAFRVLHV